MFPKGEEQTIYEGMLKKRALEETKKSKEYQDFVKKQLGDRDLGDMNDEETKAFFAKIDKKWNSESEKGKDGKTKDESLDPEEILEGLDSKTKKNVKSAVDSYFDDFMDNVWADINDNADDVEAVGEMAGDIIKELKKLIGDHVRKI